MVDGHLELRNRSLRFREIRDPIRSKCGRSSRENPEENYQTSVSTDRSKFPIPDKETFARGITTSRHANACGHTRDGREIFNGISRQKSYSCESVEPAEAG